MKDIICISGPIIHLREARALHLLKRCGSVAVTHSVELETSLKGEKLPSWISVVDLETRKYREVNMLMQSIGLHRGALVCLKRGV